MDAKNLEAEEQGLIKSTFEETMQVIEDRMRYFSKNHMSLECQLMKMPNETPKTISDIISSLGLYYFSQSPVQPKLRDLYTSQYQHVPYRCILPPPSQGQDSVQIQAEKEILKKGFEPTFSWLSRALIDSTLISLDQMEAKRLDKNVPSEWGGLTQLLIFNISKKIHLKSESKSVDKYLQRTLGKYSLVTIQKIRKIYYKGKPSALIRFKNQKSCCFAYYNLSKSQEVSRKQILGPSSEVYRVVSNRINNVEQLKWVGVIVRGLPATQTKETFLDTLRKKNISPIWMEELIQIDNFKYTLCKVNYLNDVFEFCTNFQINPPIKDVKVNLHPKSSKTWKKEEESQELLALLC